MGYGPDISNVKAQESSCYCTPFRITAQCCQTPVSSHYAVYSILLVHCRFVYDGRHDKYIKSDDDWQDVDISYGVPVLAACAAILGIGM